MRLRNSFTLVFILIAGCHFEVAISSSPSSDVKVKSVEAKYVTLDRKGLDYWFTRQDVYYSFIEGVDVSSKRERESILKEKGFLREDGGKYYLESRIYYLVP